jgi:hypothetical protein
MNQEEMSAAATAASYRSGVAARLAGVPVETLRVWERRYGVIGPQMSPRGQRLYSSVEIKRLTLIKQLVDLGHPIGAIAGLPTDALLGMRSSARALGSPAQGGEEEPLRDTRIALVGPLLSARRLEDALAGSALRVVGRCVDVANAASELRDAHADVAVIESPTLTDASIDTVARVKMACGAAQAIVLYRFAPSAVIRRLRSAGHEVARAPSDAAETVTLCQLLLQRPFARRGQVAAAAATGDAPAPRFDEHTLAALAAASTTVYCECPRHLVDLVMNLATFEAYSAECANRGPDDALLHRDLQQTAGRARAMVEDALLRVAVAEGLPLPANVMRSAGA